MDILTLAFILIVLAIFHDAIVSVLMVCLEILFGLTVFVHNLFKAFRK